MIERFILVQRFTTYTCRFFLTLITIVYNQQNDTNNYYGTLKIYKNHFISFSFCAVTFCNITNKVFRMSDVKLYMVNQTESFISDHITITKWYLSLLSICSSLSLYLMLSQWYQSNEVTETADTLRCVYHSVSFCLTRPCLWSWSRFNWGTTGTRFYRPDSLPVTQPTISKN